MMTKVFKSTIAIDLGANKTGVLLVNQAPDSSKSLSAATIAMPEGDKFIFSMKNRTAVRHRVRGKKRFNLARRLLLLIINDRQNQLKQILDSNTKQKQTEALCGLLKRRGYSRLESEIDLTILEEVDSAVFANHPCLGSYFQEGLPLAEQWEMITNDLQRVRNFLDDERPTIKEFQTYLKTEYPDFYPFNKTYCQALKTLSDDATSLVSQHDFGHLHRSQYLLNIISEIKKDSRLIYAIEAFGGAENLWRLVGNISNLQLRAHRWYFNAPWMLTDESMEPSRLQTTLVRSFKYFHPSKDQSPSFKTLIDELDSSEDIIETLCHLDPNRTIPPYEDQNNRRPPLDLTLWLNPMELTRRYGDVWKIWADRLQKAEPILNEGLDEILSKTDRKSRLAINQTKVLPILDYRFSYVLQRVLDRNKKRDPYQLRKISLGFTSPKAKSAYDLLELTIGSQHSKDFLDFAADYYEEVEKAKSGLWLNLGHSLLERADLHPPMKNKILPILVGNLFGSDELTGNRLLQHWHDKIYRNSSLASICCSIEQTRKSYGNEFKLQYLAALQRAHLNTKLSTADKELVAIEEKVQKATQFLKDCLGLKENQTKRISNPYSLSQLYTLIETERYGFTSTTLPAHLENVWRMSEGEDELLGAQASRLPADSVRPFDGALRRILDRQAWEIAKLAANEIKHQVKIENGVVDLSVLIEQNQFEFAASLATLKKNKQKADKLGRTVERQQKKWISKEDRIKSASRDICPYTGQAIGMNGEIDHIIPRSYTSEKYGTIFNSEANLIYVSQAGNQNKKEKLYQLHDLHPRYLKELFQTADLQLLTAHIEEVVLRLNNENRLKFFELLTDDEINCVRHALFLYDGSEAKEVVIAALGTLRQTKVNGTQAWFVRELIHKIQTELADWCLASQNQLNFDAWQTDVFQAKRIRETLGKENSLFIKPDFQPATSHAIDALCAYAWACGVNRICGRIGGDGNWASNAKVLCEVFPKQCQIIQVTALPMALKDNQASRSIFKEGIIGQSFLPILVKNNQIFIGFGLPKKGQSKPNNSIVVEGRNPIRLLELLSDFIEPKWSGDLSDATYHVNKTKAFELFKEVSVAEVAQNRLEVADLLQNLLYMTVRTEVASFLLENNKKKLKAKAEILDERKFQIKTNFNSRPNFKFSGVLTLPAWNDWKKVCDTEKIKTQLGQEVGDLNLSALIGELRGCGSERSHKKTRRVFSLPMIASTGSLVRISRRNYKGETLIQATSTNVPTYGGFRVKSGKVDWDDLVVDSFFKGKNLNVNGERHIPQSQSVDMGAWKKILEGDVTVEMAPGSSTRPYIRVKMPFALFKEITGIKFNSYLELPSEMKVDKFLLQDEKFQNLLGKPRSKLFFEHLGENVQFWFIVDSANAQMKKSYSSVLIKE